MTAQLLTPDGLTRTLAMAMVVSAPGPLLLLDADYRLVAASADFCSAFGQQPSDIAGQSLFEIADGLFNLPPLRTLLDDAVSAGGSGEDHELVLDVPGRGKRMLEVHARKLAYDDSDGLRMLLVIDDVSEARESDRRHDELVREKALLLQEVQHRIANSLQIIASVLMQSARQTQSDASRADLNAAHHRVMSVAAIQRQLSETSLVDVALKPYLETLCHSIAQSMIYDPKLLKLETFIDAARVPASRSISLGLIVTELVMNALKHGFPNHGPGLIRVSYWAEGDAWALAVADDGVGFNSTGPPAHVGLGSAIVQALARNLRAEVVRTALTPGTCMTVRSVAAKGAPGDAARLAEPMAPA